jgi:uncharacterized membrane protein YdjX (TVP38/TMEM64 family)
MSRTAALLRLAMIGVLFATMVALFASGKISASDIRTRVDDLGAAGPLLFIPISALLTVVFVPGPVLAAASGLLFGVALGTPISIAAATLGAVLAFAVSRWWAHDAVEHLAGARVNAIREWIGNRGFSSVFYARLAPGAPYNLVNYAAGLTPIKLRDFALATAIACSPRAFAYTALGGSINNWNRPEALIALIVLVVMSIVGTMMATSPVDGAWPRPQPTCPCGPRSRAVPYM